ncbi:MAG TPA: PilZN3 domain-containing protein [Spirochaetia bacterium]|nr:PilZN3 domain-containing protein [Spirochaetia bacterium]
MASLTSQQLARLYDTYADVELTFNAHIIVSSGLVPAEVHLRIGDQHVPCVLYASSMKGARVIAELADSVRDLMARADNLVSLRFAFRAAGQSSATSFFVAAKAVAFAEYNSQRPHVKFLTLSFTHRPSDLLVETLGMLLQIRANAAARRDERIVLTPESMKRIGLESKESCVAFEGAAHRCLLRDLSFSGAKILMPSQGVSQAPRQVTLKLAKCELRDDTVLDGSVVRVEDVEGRKDLLAVSIQYSSEPPIGYKQRISSYFSTSGKA